MHKSVLGICIFSLLFSIALSQSDSLIVQTTTANFVSYYRAYQDTSLVYSYNPVLTARSGRKDGDIGTDVRYRGIGYLGVFGDPYMLIDSVRVEISMQPIK